VSIKRKQCPHDQTTLVGVAAIAVNNNMAAAEEGTVASLAANQTITAATTETTILATIIITKKILTRAKTNKAPLRKKFKRNSDKKYG
jgi:hypothetical protein